ncbi:MAG: twin-arginine translocation signal domain-containing protein, partial [Adlercreutzia sp.]|nr:twin-arginine translocation signal domain-containing protein [Adlercreutzia sp.]
MEMQFNPTRRSFLKTAGLGAIGAASLGALSACAPQGTAASTDEVKDADNLASTGSNGWLEPEPDIAADAIVEVVDADVVVCGGG